MKGMIVTSVAMIHFLFLIWHFKLKLLAQQKPHVMTDAMTIVEIRHTMGNAE